MRAAQVKTPGGPDSILLADAPRPQPGPGEVLIKVAAAGMNRADMLQRRGLYPPPAGAPDIMGLEVSGIVLATGPGVTSLIAGDPVCALLPGGGYAEYVVAQESLCLHLSNHFDLVSAAALPEAIFTVWQTIFNSGRFQKGSRVLVHGGASGIGTMAIQMIKALGGFCAVTAGTDEKCKACLTLGADLAINYKTQDFVEILKGDPVDIVLDMVGGSYVARNIEIMAQGARHISIAYIESAKAEISIPKLMQKQLTISGSTLRGATADQKMEFALSIKQHIWPLILQGKIHPVIHAIHPFDQVVDAHKAFEKAEHTGKLLLLVDERLGK